MGEYRALWVGVGKSRGSVQAGNCLAVSRPAEWGLGVTGCPSECLHETCALGP